MLEKLFDKLFDNIDSYAKVAKINKCRYNAKKKYIQTCFQGSIK